MKDLILVLGLSVLLSGNIWGQCTPPAPTGNPGFSPDYNSLPCVEQGTFYSEVFLLENVDTLSFNGGSIKFYLDELVLDSITNLPCGLEWIANNGNNTWDTGETGCIRITGTTNDAPGQYKLGIYIHAPVPALGTTLTGELSDIVQQLQGVIGNLGIDYRYYVRVNAPGSTCSSVVTNNNALNLTASSSCAPDPTAFGISLAGSNKVMICDGDSATLDVQVSNASNPVISWDNGTTLTSSNTASTVAFPSALTYYTVSVTDSNGAGKTLYERVTVDVSTTLPDATFTFNQNGYLAAFNPVYTGGTSYTWDFGDGSTAQTKQPLHDFTANGTYTVTLTVENVCGTETFTDEVEVNVTSIADDNLVDQAISMNVVPNPAADRFVVSVDLGLSDKVQSIELIDMQGRVFDVKNEMNGNEMFVNVSEMQPGMYIVRLITEQGDVATKRVLITSN